MSLREALWRYLALSTVLLFTVGPFLWLLATALKSPAENIYAFPPVLIPAQPTLANFFTVLDTQPFWTYLANSAGIAAMAVACNVLFASLAAYPLARMHFAGRRAIFTIMVASMMIPFQLLMIPLYELAITLGLANTRLGMVLPHACTAFGVFFMRQAFLSIPPALEEVAIMEGVHRWRIFWFVMIPLVRPSLATLALFSFIASWGDFLWPLILVDDPHLFTLPLGVNRLAQAFSMDWRLVGAGTLFSIVPILLVFMFAQRYFIEGAMKGAVKG